MNDLHIGGGQLHLNEQDHIIGIYSTCYCGIPKAVKDIPAAYCECSASWFEKLFSAVFDHPVRVTILHTILSGADYCSFEIEV